MSKSPTPAESVQPLPSSVRRFRATLFGIVASVTLVALFYAEENWRGRRALEAHLAALRAMGEPTDLASLMPKAIPDAENFAMTPLIRSILNSPENENPVGFPDLTSMRVLNNQDLSEWVENIRLQLRFNPASISFPPAAELLRSLQPLEAPLEILRTEARKLPHAQILSGWVGPSSIGNHGPFFDLARLVSAHAIASLANGDKSAAADDLRVLQRMAEAQSHGTLLPVLISSAISGLICDVIEAGRDIGAWTPAQYEMFQASLSSINYPPLVSRGLRAERLAKIGFLINESSGRHLIEVTGYLQGAVRLYSSFGPRGWIDAAIVDHEFQEYLSLGYDSQPARFDRARSRQLAQIMHANGDSMLPIPRMRPRFQLSVGSILENEATHLARFGIVTVVCALERHRSESGQYPDSLSSLTPRFIDPLPADIYSGNPFIYQRTAPDKFTIHSVGADGLDNGGTGDDIPWPAR